MPKNVFRAMEIVDLTAQKVKVQAPVFEVEEAEPEEIYEGPTAEDLRLEAEAFRESWADEKEQLIKQAHEEAEQIRKQAEQTAFEEVKAQTDAAIRDKRIAEDEAERIKTEAQSEAERIIQDAENRREQVFAEARAEAVNEGREEGWQEGREEAQRLIDRLHKILDASIEKRQEIIDEAETQLIDLVLLISRKVVKVISENQKNVVINNIVQALRKLKSRGDVAIRVNLADLDLTTEHVKDFMRMAENVKSITVLEDSSVDKGGAVIETDFGQIDARVSSQLREIEEKILELVPIRSRGEG
ncbi:MAG: flagellar assembly protein FliH [Spirochaetales bacterium]|nr:MAG: flagellar assembly protein FliH [Spirochaetales bacterium]